MKRIIFTVIFLSILFSVYIDSGYTTFIQPNGVEFIGRKWGDEFFHWLETEDGYRFNKYIDGYYYYAVLNDVGDFTPSQNKVGIDLLLNTSFKLERSPQRKIEINNKISQFRESLSEKRDEYISNSQNRQPIKLGVIRVEFSGSDTHNINYTTEHFNQMFFSDNYWVGTDVHPNNREVFGSMKDYFNDQSSQNIDIIGYNGNFVYNSNWATLPYQKSYYNLMLETWDNEFLNDVFNNVADTTGSNMDYWAIVYAGLAIGDGTLWPSANSNLGIYIMSEELVVNSDTIFSNIGTHCHEFPHLAFGAGDENKSLYTDSPDPQRMSLMSAGNKNGPDYDHSCPAPISPLYKYIYDWIENPILITENSIDFLIERSNGALIYYIIHSPISNEFFILENRNNEGFNRFTPNVGYLEFYPYGINIWQGAPDWLGGTGIGSDFVEVEISNDDEAPIIPYYHFPYNIDSVLDFNYISNPSSTLRNGTNSFVSINNIRWDDQFDDGIVDIIFYEDILQINEDTNWEGVFELSESILIQNDATLNVSSGTQLLMDGNIWINIYNGNILFNGLVNDSIKINYSNTEDIRPWGGLLLVKIQILKLNFAT